MTRDELEVTIRKMYDARRFEDTDRVLAYFSPNATFRIMANEELGDLGNPLKGHDELRPVFEGLFEVWDWLDFPIESILIDDSGERFRAAVHSSGTMRFTPTGREVQVDTLDLLTFEDGRIIDFVEFFDTDLIGKVAKEFDGGS